MAAYEFVLWRCLCCVMAGYLLGNVQVAILLSKLLLKDDVRTHGSGNAGSTNMLRVFGLKIGLVTFVLDFLKGVLAVVLGRLLMGTLGGYVFALFTVIGHCWPVMAGFRGGKGVATTFGFFWTVYPMGAVVITLVGVIILLTYRRVSAVSLVGSLVFQIEVLAFRWNDFALWVVSLILVTFIWVRHMDNIRRIFHGEEKELFPPLFRKK